MIRVFATREGLPGGKTSSGYRVEGEVPFVALPSTAALRMWIKVRNIANQKETRAIVLDVGPWNEKDHGYVFQPRTYNGTYGGPEVRPASERGTDQFGRKTNGAGIDLGEKVWNILGMSDNSDVEWEFV